MNYTAGIRHLYCCPSCLGETWHSVSIVGEQRYGLLCLVCGLTSLLTQEQFNQYQQQREAELDEALQNWEESWQSFPEPPELDD
jgi:hypothetical protein